MEDENMNIGGFFSILQNDGDRRKMRWSNNVLNFRQLQFHLIKFERGVHILSLPPKVIWSPF
jgi:hypothetical protein